MYMFNLDGGGGGGGGGGGSGGYDHNYGCDLCCTCGHVTNELL